MFTKMGMEEAILKKNSSPPATHQMNTKREPIDGIFVTKGIGVLKAGYLPFGEGGQSDHRALWIELEANRVLGMTVSDMKKIQPRRLTCSIPSLVSKYNTKLKEELKKEKLMEELAIKKEQKKLDGMTN